LGYTQAQLADRIGTIRANVANWETGRAMPGADVWVKIQGLKKRAA